MPDRSPYDDAKPQPGPSLPQAPLHIPGAGTFVVYILLVSLSILFIASISAYLIVRSHAIAMSHMHEWPPAGLPNPPASLWLSTPVIIVTSFAIQIALNAIRNDNEKRLRLFLRITFGLGILFLILQCFNWYEFYKSIPPSFKIEGAYLGMFYTLTGLHAAHVLGGLIPLGLVTHHAAQGRYSRNFHPGVRYTTIYWHFLAIIWIALFITISM